MSTLTSSSDIGAKSLPTRLTSTIPRASALAGIVAAAVTTAGAIVLRVAGIPMAVRGEIPVGSFAQLTLIGAIIGGCLLAVLNRYSSSPRRRFVQLTIGLAVLTCAAPVALADTIGSGIALVALHLIAASIVVPLLARHAN